MHIVKLPAIKFQSDDGAGSGGAGGGDGKTDDGKGKTDDSSGQSKQGNDISKEIEAKLAKLTEDVDFFKGEVKKVAAERDEYKRKARELERNGAEGSGDIEGLKKSFLEEKQTLEAQLKEEREAREKLSSQFHTTLAKDKLRSVSSGVIADSAFETFFLENGHLFDVDKDGNLTSKDGIRTPAEAIKKIVTEKPFYAAAVASKQTGFPGKTPADEGGGYPDGFFTNWTNEQRRAWAAKPENRQAAKAMGPSLMKG